MRNKDNLLIWAYKMEFHRKKQGHIFPLVEDP